ncbi:hypothetical protein LCGC14_1101860 [marine sediment metagenome]|uniref:Uncharacterized protein n=1 Tax=marine sediment metagenome TaxID=412755 RepID=A0A0F9QFE6_9ZZZZ
MDVYLAGYANEDWRDEFIRQVSDDINVFDPMVHEYHNFDEEEYANQVAKELELAETSEVSVFYFDTNWQSLFSMIQFGDMAGRGQQVIACIPNEIESEEKIRRYCEYRGIIITESLEELVSNVEALLAEKELCEVS